MRLSPKPFCILYTFEVVDISGERKGKKKIFNNHPQLTCTHIQFFLRLKLQARQWNRMQKHIQ